jgi:hypothetical protein
MGRSYRILRRFHYAACEASFEAKEPDKSSDVGSSWIAIGGQRFCGNQSGGEYADEKHRAGNVAR